VDFLKQVNEFIPLASFVAVCVGGMFGARWGRR